MPKCPNCDGKKSVKLYLNIHPKYIIIWCEFCGGRGKVTLEKLKEYRKGK